MVGIFLVVLSSLFAFCRSECVYNNLYAPGLVQFDDPATAQSDTAPLGLSAMNERTAFNTVDKCVNYCGSKKWCVATSNHPYPDEHFCQFHTDMHLIGFFGHLTCDEKNFNCVVNNDTLINIDGQVFEVVNAVSYGFNSNQRVLPSRILPFEEGATEFCKVIKSNADVFHNAVSTSKVYSEYYGTESGMPSMWTDRNGKVFNAGANFYKEGASAPAFDGIPITGMRRDDVFPIAGQRRDIYHFYRHEYLSNKECSIKESDVNFIDPHALRGTGYMLIKNGANKYLKCDVEGTNDDGTHCSWHGTPAMIWSIGESDLAFTDFGSNLAGFNKTLIGHTVSGKEVGWIDRSHCHSDTDESEKDGIRLLVDGKKNGQGLHCGATNWVFYRDIQIKTPPNQVDTGDKNAEMGAGSAICHNQWKDGIHNSWVTSCVGATFAVDGEGATVCSLSVNFFGGKPMCSGKGPTYGAGNMTVEQVFVGTGKLYKVTSGTKVLSCSLYGDKKCRWSPVETSSRQIFKFNNNFITPTKETDQTKLSNAYQSVTVYELVGNFWTAVGQLELDSATNTLRLTDSKTSPGVHGWVKTNDNRIFKQHTHLGITKTDSSSDLVGVSQTGDVLTLTEETDFVVSNSEYNWVTDGSGRCPPGHYLHQVVCEKNQMCEQPIVGCVNATKTECVIQPNATDIVVPIKQNQFVHCPTGSVVVARGDNDIKCQNVTITPIKGSYTFPTVPTVGFLASYDKSIPLATKAAITNSNWVGRPIQAINPQQGNVTSWYYGESCYVKYENSRSAAKKIFPSARIKGDKISCGHGEFISQLRCLTDDCRNGLEARCEVAANCRLADENPTIIEATATTQPICPYGKVLTQIQCVGEGETGASIIPCEKVSIWCQTVIFDPDYHPTKPPDPGSSSETKSSLKIILISLGAGLPLIVLSAIACLFCIPDNSEAAVAVQENTRITVTDAELVGDSYEGIRRRRNRIAMY